jgi:hypothetical protein
MKEVAKRDFGPVAAAILIGRQIPSRNLPGRTVAHATVNYHPVTLKLGQSDERDLIKLATNFLICD